MKRIIPILIIGLLSAGCVPLIIVVEVQRQLEIEELVILLI